MICIIIFLQLARNIFLQGQSQFIIVHYGITVLLCFIIIYYRREKNKQTKTIKNEENDKEKFSNIMEKRGGKGGKGEKIRKVGSNNRRKEDKPRKIRRNQESLKLYGCACPPWDG